MPGRTSRSHRAAETLIVSDLHLGLRGCRAGDLLRLLETHRHDRLVLLGDVFHELRFSAFCADTWRLLRHLHRLATARSGPEIICVVGNHDRHLADPIGRLLGIELRESFAWTSGGRRIEALHGDRFDRFISRNPRLSTLISTIYTFCERHLSREGVWTERLDRWHARSLSDRLATAALDYADAAKVDVVVCGHTHEPLLRERDGVAYVNTGAWVGRPGSFVTVGSDGIRHHAFP